MQTHPNVAVPAHISLFAIIPLLSFPFCRCLNYPSQLLAGCWGTHQCGNRLRGADVVTWDMQGAPEVPRGWDFGRGAGLTRALLSVVGRSPVTRL